MINEELYVLMFEVTIDFFPSVLAVQNERQPRNSATIRYDMIEDRNIRDGTVAAAFYPVPTSKTSIASTGSAFRSTAAATSLKRNSGVFF